MDCETFVVECLTDNLNRSVSDLRAVVNKCHIKMGAIGSVTFNDEIIQKLLKKIQCYYVRFWLANINFSSDSEVAEVKSRKGPYKSISFTGKPKIIIYIPPHIFKPVATIMQAQETIDKDGNILEMHGKGRHDPCVVPRAVPIVEAMAALVIADYFLLDKISDTLNVSRYKLSLEYTTSFILPENEVKVLMDALNISLKTTGLEGGDFLVVARNLMAQVKPQLEEEVKENKTIKKHGK